MKESFRENIDYSFKKDIYVQNGLCTSQSKSFNLMPGLYDYLMNKLTFPLIFKADYKKHVEIMKRIFSNIPEKANLLDIACGTGIVLEFLPKSTNYNGLDLSIGMLKQSRKKAKRKGIEINSYLFSALELPFVNESFDIVTTNLSLHFFKEYRKALTEVHRVLKKDGRLIICNPFKGVNPELENKWADRMENKLDGTHAITLESTSEILKELNMEMNEIDKNGILLYFEAVKK